MEPALSLRKKYSACAQHDKYEGLRMTILHRVAFLRACPAQSVRKRAAEESKIEIT